MRNFLICTSLLMCGLFFSSFVHAVGPCQNFQLGPKDNNFIYRDQNPVKYEEIIQTAKDQEKAGAHVCLQNVGVSVMMAATWTLPDTNNSSRIITLYRLNTPPVAQGGTSKGAGSTPVALAIQGVNFGDDHPGSTRNVLKKSCNGELTQLQCRNIPQLQYNDEFCFGICYLKK